MKIELEVENKEEFEIALNNSIVALHEFQAEISLMGYTKNEQFSKLIEKYGYDNCIKQLRKRLTILKDIYYQVQNIQ